MNFTSNYRLPSLVGVLFSACAMIAFRAAWRLANEFSTNVTFNVALILILPCSSGMVKTLYALNLML
jgi:hypothetical protein